MNKDITPPSLPWRPSYALGCFNKNKIRENKNMFRKKKCIVINRINDCSFYMSYYKLEKKTYSVGKVRAQKSSFKYFIMK